MLIYGYYPVCSGGTENQCRLQSHELVRRGYRCCVLTARISKSLPKYEMDSGTNIVRLTIMQPVVDSLRCIKNRISRNASGLNPERSYEKKRQIDENRGTSLARVVQWLNASLYLLGASVYLFRQRHAIDIIHTHVASWNAGFVGWIGNLLGIPVLCKAAYLPAFHEYEHSVLFSEKWRQWRKYIRYIALTKEMADDIAGNGVPWEMIHTIPNGVSIPDDIAPVETNRSVLYVGNFTQGAPHKGFDILIEAWARVHRELPWACLVIAGGGDSRRWREMATVLGCGDSIRFAGHISEMAACYLQAGLFVLPSRGEGISNALLEANSFGIPAVASDIPGNREVIVHERTGLLVPVNDAKTLSESIVRLLQDDGSRKQMGEAARNRIIENHSIGSVVNSVCDLYASMIPKRDS
jgi:glycosyltransferase involved in cell wall biosynthesis